MIEATVCTASLAACSPDPSASAASAPSPTPTTTTTGYSPSETSTIDAAAAASLIHGVTVVVVSIVDPKRSAFLKAYGTADTAGAPMLPDLHYRIASVSRTPSPPKAVLRLGDQRKVALTGPARAQ